jgi:hypothetical protein
MASEYAFYQIFWKASVCKKDGENFYGALKR